MNSLLPSPTDLATLCSLKYSQFIFCCLTTIHIINHSLASEYSLYPFDKQLQILGPQTTLEISCIQCLDAMVGFSNKLLIVGQKCLQTQKQFCGLMVVIILLCIPPEVHLAPPVYLLRPKIKSDCCSTRYTRHKTWKFPQTKPGDHLTSTSSILTNV